MPVIHDPVWGTHRVEEPLLGELLESRALARQKKLHISGASYLVRPNRDSSRYDHSVGVMLLIRLLGGSLPEQAAGLIHDVSHTAFSHVIDRVFPSREENFHELYFETYLKNSDIPGILARHGLTLAKLLPPERWGLLEQPSPDLCADRIDYTLRDLLRSGSITPEEIRAFLGALAVYENKIVVKELEAAKWFTHQYFNEVHDHFMHPLEIFAYHRLGEALKLALAEGVLTVDELFAGTDEDVLERLRACPGTAAYLTELHHGIEVVEDEQNFTIRGFSKGRLVDPLVLQTGGEPVRCTALAPEQKVLHRRVLEKAKKGVGIRLVTSG